MGKKRILLVATRRGADDDPTPRALDALASHATRHTLERLSREQTVEPLRSTLGDAVHLDRVADILHRVRRGNPTYGMELA